MKKNTNFNDFEDKNASFEPSSREKAVVVGLCTGQDHQFEHSMEELISLCEACDMEVVAMLTQTLPAPHQALYIGTGKVQEVIDTCVTLDADTVVFDNALSPSQVRNLSTEIQLPILDRTALILEIFSNRAQTREAKLQVELARLQYLLPRLAGMGTALSRQGGGSGSRSNKGAGEKKLELDRRLINDRIAQLRRELAEVVKHRDITRAKREKQNVPVVAIVGYTNAGKSTLLNHMTDADVLETVSENKEVEKASRAAEELAKKGEAVLDLNKPYEEMNVAELQEVILGKMRKNGTPMTDQIIKSVRDNEHLGSLISWAKSF